MAPIFIITVKLPILTKHRQLGFDVSSRTIGQQSMAASSMVLTGAWNNQFRQHHW